MKTLKYFFTLLIIVYGMSHAQTNWKPLEIKIINGVPHSRPSINECVTTRYETKYGEGWAYYTNRCNHNVYVFHCHMSSKYSQHDLCPPDLKATVRFLSMDEEYSARDKLAGSINISELIPNHEMSARTNGEYRYAVCDVIDQNNPKYKDMFVYVSGSFDRSKTYSCPLGTRNPSNYDQSLRNLRLHTLKQKLDMRQGNHWLKFAVKPGAFVISSEITPAELYISIYVRKLSEAFPEVKQSMSQLSNIT